MTRHEDPKLPQEALEAFADLVAAMRLEGMTDSAILDQLNEEYGPDFTDNDQAIFAAAVETLKKVAAGSRTKTPQELASLIDPEKEGLPQRMIFNMVIGFLREGVRGDAVLDAVTELIQTKLPDVTRTQVSDAYISYGKAKFPGQINITIPKELSKKLKTAQAKEIAAKKSWNDLLKRLYMKSPSGRKLKLSLYRSLSFSVLWIAGALWLQFKLGGWNPFHEVSLIWNGQYTQAKLVDVSEEWVDGDEVGGGGNVQTYNYQYLVKGKKFTTSSSRLELKERETVKFLPENPSVAFIEGYGWHSSTEQVIRRILFRLVALLVPLYVAYVYASSGIREYRKIL